MSRLTSSGSALGKNEKVRKRKMDDENDCKTIAGAMANIVRFSLNEEFRKNSLTLFEATSTNEMEMKIFKSLKSLTENKKTIKKQGDPPATVSNAEESLPDTATEVNSSQLLDEDNQPESSRQTCHHVENYTCPPLKSGNVRLGERSQCKFGSLESSKKRFFSMDDLLIVSKQKKDETALHCKTNSNIDFEDHLETSSQSFMFSPLHREKRHGTREKSPLWKLNPISEVKQKDSYSFSENIMASKRFDRKLLLDIDFEEGGNEDSHINFF